MTQTTELYCCNSGGWKSELEGLVGLVPSEGGSVQAFLLDTNGLLAIVGIS